MKIHWGKTEVMVVSRQGEECKVYVDEKEIEQVLSDAYLPIQQGHPFSSFFFHCPLTSWDNPV